MEETLLQRVDEIRRHPKLVIAEDYELSIKSIQEKFIAYQNGQRIHASEGSSSWICLRLLHRNRPGRAATELATPEALHELVDQAFRSAEMSNLDPWFRLPILKGQNPQQSPESLPWNPPHSIYPDITVAVDQLEERYSHQSVDCWILRKRDKIELFERRFKFGNDFKLTQAQEGQELVLEQSQSFSRELDERRRGLDRLIRCSEMLKAAEPEGPKGFSDCILSPQIVSILMKELAPWFFADRILYGKSPLRSYREGRIGSDLIHIIDSSDVDGAVGNQRFDAEGVLSQTTALVTEGNIVGSLYDSYMATRENRLSTGNFQHESPALFPRIGVTNFYLRPGTKSLKELLMRLDRGLWLEHAYRLTPLGKEGHQFALEAMGWRVEGGQAVVPVSKVLMKIDLFELFQRCVELGEDLTFRGRYGGCSTLISNIPLIE